MRDIKQWVISLCQKSVETADDHKSIGTFMRLMPGWDSNTKEIKILVLPPPTEFPEAKLIGENCERGMLGTTAESSLLFIIINSNIPRKLIASDRGRGRMVVAKSD